MFMNEALAAQTFLNLRRNDAPTAVISQRQMHKLTLIYEEMLRGDKVSSTKYYALEIARVMSA